ncbi:MAG TPA: catechol 1,2-dioxygenase [Gemmatimonadaceae bacterium]|nr:catechol 1,2-dioxygenase [Gemmatimonadaceae bacterium]
MHGSIPPDAQLERFHDEQIERFLDRISGSENSAGDPRVKQIVRRIVSDLFRTIEDFDVQPDEYWTAVSYLTEAGQAREMGLLSPGLGFDHFLDLRMDAADRAAGLEDGTTRTIEGPLYVAGAPLSRSEARLDDGTEAGETLFMTGRVLNTDGEPVDGAIVDVWHANALGNYSFFDTSQPPFNLRRRIETGADGRYRFRSIMPAGYGVAPDGPTQQLLDQLGRHGQRPAHIHFFVSAPGYRHLTTQINIAGDPLLHDDFAFATRDELIPDVVRHDDPAEIRGRGLDAPFAEIAFDFVLQEPVPGAPASVVRRERASAVTG